MTLPPAWAACSNAWQLHPWENSSWSPTWTTPVSAWSYVLLSCGWEERPTDIQLVTTSFQGVLEGWGVPWAFSPRLSNPSSLIHSLKDLCSRPFTSSFALLWTQPQCPCHEWPELNTGFEVQPFQWQGQGKSIPLVLLATLLLTQARMPLASLATWSHCRTMENENIDIYFRCNLTCNPRNSPRMRFQCAISLTSVSL